MSFDDEFDKVWKPSKNQSSDDEFDAVWNKPQKKTQKPNPFSAAVQQVGQKLQSLDKGGELAVHGVIGGASKVMELPRDLLYNKIGTTGNKVLDAVYGKKEQLTSNVARQAQQRIRGDYLKKPGIDKVDKFMMQTGETLVPIATSLATGPAAPAAFAAMTGGNYAKDAEIEGANPAQQLAYGSVMGAVETLTEKLPYEKIMRALGGETGVKAMLSTMGAEGLQEATTNPINVIAKRLIYGGGKDEKIVDLGRELQSFAAGATTAGILHGGAAMAHKAAKAVQNHVSPKVTPQVLEQTEPMLHNIPEDVQKPEIKSEQPVINVEVANQNKPVIEANNAQITQAIKPTIETDIADYATGKKPLPETEAELQGILDAVEKMPDDMKLNLQFFSQAIQNKISKFRTNTLQRSVDFDDAEKDQMLLDEFGFEGQSAKAWEAQANQSVSQNQQAVEDAIKSQQAIQGGQQAHEAAIIARKHRDEARKSGDYSKLTDWLKTVADKTRETARALKGTDTAWQKTKSADGAIIQAQRKVLKSEEQIGKTDKPKADKVKAESQSAKGQVRQARKEAAKRVVNEIKPEDLLAARVISTLKRPKTKETDPIHQMVNELYRVAQESPLPPKSKPKKNQSPTEFLAHAMKNKAEYARVWVEAKKIVQEQYKNDIAARVRLEKYFGKGIAPPYSQAKLNQSMAETMKELNTTMDEIARSSSVDKQTALEKISDVIIKKTGLESDEAYELANNIFANYDAAVKEKSQKILENMFKKVSPRKRKKLFEKVQELINLGAYDDSKIVELIKAKEGIPVLAPSEAQFITEAMEKVKSLPDGSREQQVLLSRVQQIIADKKIATTADKIKGAFRIALLSNFKTQIRNVLGNVVFGTVENIKDIPADAIDKVTSKFTGKRVYNYNPAANLKSEAAGFKKGLADQIDDVRRGVDTSPTRGQLELPSGRTFNNPVLQAIDQAVKTSLKFGDRPFYEAARNRRLNELKRIYKTDGITEEMELEAKMYALERTFQSDSATGEWLARLKNVKTPALKLVFESALPFTQTPGNIFDRLIEYSPVGLAKAVIMPFRARKTGQFNQRQFVDSMARSFTGTGLMMLGYALAKAGIIIGGGDKNKEKEFNRMTGKQPYTLKVGDVRLSFDWAPPVGSMFAIGANAYKAGQTKEDILAKIDKTAQGGVDTFFSQSVMSGLQELFGGYSAYETVKNAALSPLTLANPTLIRQTTQAVDPYERETMAGNPAQQNFNKIIANTPGLSQTLPRKVDTLGNEVKRDNNLFNVYLNPARTYKESNNPIVKEIQGVYEQTGDKDVLPRKAPTKLGGRVLKPQEYIELQKLIGQKTTERLNEILVDQDYINATPDIKAKVLADVISSAYNNAKEEFGN